MYWYWPHFIHFPARYLAGRLSFWFGFGVARKSIRLEDIRSVEVVVNPWYYFWGIKSIPGGCLYSITPGGRAVEVVLENKKLIRLGTNIADEIKEKLDESRGIAI